MKAAHLQDSDADGGYPCLWLSSFSISGGSCSCSTQTVLCECMCGSKELILSRGLGTHSCTVPE